MNPGAPLGKLDPKLLPESLKGVTNLSDLTPGQQADMLIYMQQGLVKLEEEDKTLSHRTAALNIAGDANGQKHFVVTYSGNQGLSAETMGYIGSRVPGAEVFVDGTKSVAGNRVGDAEASMERLMSGNNVASGTPEMTSITGAVTNRPACDSCRLIYQEQYGVNLPKGAVGFTPPADSYSVGANGAVMPEDLGADVMTPFETAAQSDLTTELITALNAADDG